MRQINEINRLQFHYLYSKLIEMWKFFWRWEKEGGHPRIWFVPHTTRTALTPRLWSLAQGIWWISYRGHRNVPTCHSDCKFCSQWLELKQELVYKTTTSTLLKINLSKYTTRILWQNSDIQYSCNPGIPPCYMYATLKNLVQFYEPALFDKPLIFS